MCGITFGNELKNLTTMYITSTLNIKADQVSSPALLTF